MGMDMRIPPVGNSGNPDLCPTWYWKKRYANDSLANRELIRLRNSPDLRHKDIMMYKCQSGECGGWHIGHPTGSSLEKK